MKEVSKTLLYNPPVLGQLVRGKIINKGNSSVFLDLSPFGTGVIYGKEFFKAKENLKELKIGDEVLAKVISLDNEEGLIELSVSGVLKMLALESLNEKKEKGEIFKVKVVGTNRGGLIVETNSISGFIPISQLSKEHFPKIQKDNFSNLLKELKKFIGKELKVRILSVSKGGEVIFSERALENSEIIEKLKKYQVGTFTDGEVVGFSNFGIFLKVNGIIGLLPLSCSIEDEEKFKIGQKIKVKIIKTIKDKIFFSL